MSTQVVIPARNEAEHLGALLAMLSEAPDLTITVVDNASTDETSQLASSIGVRVIHESRIGKGFAAAAGVRAAAPGRVFLCDADIKGLTLDAIHRLEDLANRSEAPLVRLALGRRPEDAPVTTLTALPLLSAIGIDAVTEPLGGLMLLEREFVLSQHLPGGWGFDVALTLAGLRSAGAAPELEVDGIAHRRKPLTAYRSMADDVVAAILAAAGVRDWDHRDCTRCSQPLSAARRQSEGVARAAPLT
jgi:glucosyl-3-phosphoglycerate synthase